MTSFTCLTRQLRCSVPTTANSPRRIAAPKLGRQLSPSSSPSAVTATSRSQAVPLRSFQGAGLRQKADVRTQATAAAQQKVPTDSAKFISEFTAQALFNYLSCTAWATSQMMAHTAVQQTLMFAGAHIIILPMIIYIFANASGAHFNPIITASFVASGRQDAQSGISYLTAQVLGGVLGAALAMFSLPGGLQTAEMLGGNAIPAGRTAAQAFLGEAVGSFFFISVLFACLVDPRGWGKLKPFCVPVAITLLMWLLGPISSACINPARAFGVAFVTGAWSQHWLYWIADILGGCAAAILYSKILLPKDA